jgi:peptidyl-prolyl cis-trans isomerase C
VIGSITGARVALGVAFGALLATLAIDRRSNAEDAAAPPGRRAAVVARLGPERVITVGDLEDAIERMPGFQRATYGATPDAIRRRVLSEVLVPQALLTSAAEAKGLAQQPATAHAVDWARSAATVRAIHARLGGPASVSMDDVRAYYDVNRARFESPERYRLSRILCATREEAQQVLDAAKADPTPKNFETLAREHSADKASYLRGGDLGFLTAEGTSTEPGLVVDPAIVRAAQRLRDGEIVPAPVAEGERFSVVWRRGTLASVQKTLRDPAVVDSIRRTIEDDRAKRETDALIADLRASKVRDVDASALEPLEWPR